MHINTDTYKALLAELAPRNAVLVAVSKTKPAAAIEALYNLGHRDFGENYVQELVDKSAQLPADIRWHFIGHLQSNKVKYIAPFVHLIHGIDSLKLLKEVEKQAAKAGRVLDVLLQVHIAKEETKFGFDEGELFDEMFVQAVGQLRHVRIRGLMGMASFTDNTAQVQQEFGTLKQLFDRYQTLLPTGHAFDTLSMGMSGDYPLALEAGSNMIRIGSLLFGSR